MTVTLIGSRAMKKWFPDAREPNGDWDWQCENQWEGRRAQPSIAGPRDWDFPEGSRHEMFRDERLAQWPCWTDVATPHELYTMKISHSFWEINGPANWNKHASDIIFLSRKGCEFKRRLYDILLPIWKEKYKKHQTNTKLQKEEFFADAVVRKYDHDSLHASVAYGDHPLYEDILLPGETVAVDSDKFWAMDFETQLKTVREEIYATALERILIPGNYLGSPSAAYWWALRRTATSLFKGIGPCS